MDSLRSFSKVASRYVLRVAIFVVVFALVGLGAGYYFGPAGAGAFGGAIIGLCLALLIPGSSTPDGPDRARHTATMRGNDAGGSGGSL